MTREGIGVPVGVRWDGIMPCRDGYVYMMGGTPVQRHWRQGGDRS